MKRITLLAATAFVAVVISACGQQNTAKKVESTTTTETRGVGTNLNNPTPSTTTESTTTTTQPTTQTGQ